MNDSVDEDKREEKDASGREDNNSLLEDERP